MKVSVIVTSYRLGGVDLVLQGLKNQRMTDFEALLVDTLYSQRKDQVDRYARRIGIDDRLVHLPSAGGSNLPKRHFAESLNVGIKKATGELLVFLNDYSYPLPMCIEEHWDIYSSSRGKATTIGSYDYVQGPALRRGYELIFSEKMSMAGYLDLIEKNSEKLGVSIFDEEFTSEKVSELKVRRSLVGQRYERELEYHGVGKGDLAPWYEWCYKNDSVPRATALDVGGVDEELGTNDEFAFAYDIVMHGQRLVLNPRNRVLVSMYIDRFPSTTPLHPPLESYEIWARKKNVEWIKLKEGIQPTERVMWYVRTVLLSPRVARFLRATRLEGIGVDIIGAMALGRIDERNNQPIIGARIAKTEPNLNRGSA